MPELLITPVRAGVQNRTQLRNPIEAAQQRRDPQVIQRSRRGGRVCTAPREVGGQQTQSEARGHGLAIVELGVRRPARVEDVCWIG
jgi:hypothetical protein